MFLNINGSKNVFSEGGKRPGPGYYITPEELHLLKYIRNSTAVKKTWKYPVNQL